MTPEERLQVVGALAETLGDTSAEVRRDALHSLVELGADGLFQIIDTIDDSGTKSELRREAVQALGNAFAEGRVDKSKMIRNAITALEKCLASSDEQLCECAVEALGQIGTEAISCKGQLLALLDGKRQNNRIRVKTAASLLKISPAH